VQLRPAERRKTPLAFVQQEALGREPGFALALLQRGQIPAALLAVPREGSVVQCQPLGLVDADAERAHGHVGGVGDGE